MTQRSLARRWTYDLSRIAARLVGVVLFRIRCEGRRHVPTSGGVLVCANHQSFLDPILVGLAIDRRLNYLARRTLFWFAPFRWLISWYDAIPIDQEGIGIGGIKETLRRLKRGEMVLIFPEGARTLDGEIDALQPGFCALARRAKVPLLPVGFDGAFDIWPRRKPLPRCRGVIRIQIASPLGVADVQKLTDDQLITELDRRMRACFAAAQQSRDRALGRGSRANSRPNKLHSAEPQTES